jgi:hypothetical protein
MTTQIYQVPIPEYVHFTLFGTRGFANGIELRILR